MHPYCHAPTCDLNCKTEALTRQWFLLLLLPLLQQVGEEHHQVIAYVTATAGTWNTFSKSVLHTLGITHMPICAMTCWCPPFVKTKDITYL